MDPTETLQTSEQATRLELERLVQRTNGLQPWRRVFHAACGVVLALGPGVLGLDPRTVALLLAAAVVLLFAVDFARLRAPGLNALFFRLFPALASPREAAGIASSTWYAVGALLVWAFFPPGFAVPSILVLAFADPAASVLGRVVKSPRIGSGSVFGCLVFTLVASLILLPSAGFPRAPLLAALVAAVESTPWKLDDNLTVPLSSAVLLSLLA